MILGPRQAGKSTLAEQFAKDARRYITFDEPNAFALAKTDPGAFLDTHGAPLVLDEIQRVPELLLPIKLRVDRNREPGSYLLTGSANILALPKVADSLAGRIELIDLLPLTQSEIEETKTNFVDRVFKHPPAPGALPKGLPILERMQKGGFPEPALKLSARRRGQWMDSYVRTLLEKDVRDLANIEALTQMPRLLQILAARSGETLNIASLSRETGIPHTTLTRYIDLLKALFLLQFVPSWSADVDVRLTKASKVYMIDPALATHLSNANFDAAAQDAFLRLKLVRGFVANELGRLVSLSDSRPWLMHLRTVRQKEVDFVLEGRDRRIVGLQVKAAPSVQPADIEGLCYLQELAPDRFHLGVLFYEGSEVLPLAPQIWAMPLEALWSAW